MKKIYWIAFMAFFSMLASCDVLQQASDAAQFAQCNFSIDKVAVSQLGGISLQNIQKPSDIHPMEIVTLTQKVLAGNLPVTMEVAVKAANNQSLKAGISGLDWQLYMKDKMYSEGKITDAVEVLPGQSTTFPLNVSFNLLHVMSGSNLQDILNVVLHLNDKEKLKELDLKLQLKPYYLAGTQVREYPGYITIRP